MTAITPPDWYVRSLNRTTANEAVDLSVIWQPKGAGSNGKGGNF
jgi:hypothetical protein